MSMIVKNMLEEYWTVSSSGLNPIGRINTDIVQDTVCNAVSNKMEHHVALDCLLREGFITCIGLKGITMCFDTV